MLSLFANVESLPAFDTPAPKLQALLVRELDERLRAKAKGDWVTAQASDRVISVLLDAIGVRAARKEER